MGTAPKISQAEGIRVPTFIYGTAWKEEKTEGLTLMALESGFTAIDTANQRKHYYEEAVGAGIQKFIKSAKGARENLFIQTKFTFINGQDHRLPYDRNADYETQVTQSLESSLKHLGVEHVDSYLLHGPFSRELGEEDFRVWAQMERLLELRRARSIGVSNFDVHQLREFCQRVKVKPHFVQNRCYANVGWDKQLRGYCKSQEIFYQGFSLLTANQRELRHPFFQELTVKYAKTIPQIVFRFAQQAGMIPLTGSSDTTHIKQDLEIFDFELSKVEITAIENISNHPPNA